MSVTPPTATTTVSPSIGARFTRFAPTVQPPPPILAAQDGAGPSTLSSSYPSAFDTAVTVTEDVTVLVSQWPNYLALLIEAVMGEIGAIGNVDTGLIGTKASLMNYLGTSVQQALSVTRAAGSGVAGQVFGIQGFYANETGSSVGTSGPKSQTLTAHYGRNSVAQQPVCFVASTGNINWDETNPAGGWIDAPVVWGSNARWINNDTQIQVTYRAGNCRNATTNGYLANGTVSTDIHGIAFYMVDR